MKLVNSSNYRRRYNVHITILINSSTNLRSIKACLFTLNVIANLVEVFALILVEIFVMIPGEIFVLINSSETSIIEYSLPFVFVLQVLASDGATVLLELAAESDEDANDWIVNICQVVADSVRTQIIMQDSFDFFILFIFRKIRICTTYGHSNGKCSCLSTF